MRPLALVLALCLGLRLAFFLAVQPWKEPVERGAILVGDPVGYHALATTLLSDGRFAHRPDGPPDLFRTPAYPLFLAGIYAVAGPRPWVALLVQIALDTAACALLFVTLSRMLAPEAAFWAALLYAIDPFHILHSVTLASDMLFVAVLIVLVYLIVAATQARDPRQALLGYALAGLCVGLATLVRPIAQFVPLLLLGYLLARHRRALRLAVGYGAVMMLAFLLVLSPWLLRNRAITGHAFLSTSGPYNLLVIHVAPMVSRKTGVPIPELQQRLLAEADSSMRADGHDPRTLNEFRRMQYWNRLSMRIIREDPLALAATHVRGVVNSLFNVSTSGFAAMLGIATPPIDLYATQSPLGLFGMLARQRGALGVGLLLVIVPYLMILYVLTLVGVANEWRRGDRRIVVLWIALAAYFLAIAGAGGVARYRLPAMPFLLTFVGSGAAAAIGFLRVRRMGSAGRPVAPRDPA